MVSILAICNIGIFLKNGSYKLGTQFRPLAAIVETLKCFLAFSLRLFDIEPSALFNWPPGTLGQAKKKMSKIICFLPNHAAVI